MTKNQTRFDEPTNRPTDHTSTPTEELYDGHKMKIYNPLWYVIIQSIVIFQLKTRKIYGYIRPATTYTAQAYAQYALYSDDIVLYFE